MKIVLGSNIFGKYHRQDVAVDSWKHLMGKYPDFVQIKAVQFEDEPTIEYDGIEVLPKLGRSSLDIVPHGTKKLPIVRDILEEVYKSVETDESVTHIGWVNSDCIITSLIHELYNKIQPPAIAVSRLDIQDVNSFDELASGNVHVLRLEIAGYDFLVVTKEWWKKYNHLLQDYILGISQFDQIFAGIISVTGGQIFNAPTFPILFHIRHEIQWKDDTPELQWNTNLRKSTPFDHLCYNMMHYHLQKNLVNRKPFGAFMEPQPGEKEFSQEFFNIFSLETENHLRYNP